MNETKNDGGPAFPIPPVGTGDPRDGMSSGSSGLTMRDWFASQANEEDLVPYLPKSDRDYLWALFNKDSGSSVEIQIARMQIRCRAKYKYADHMLKAREQ